MKKAEDGEGTGSSLSQIRNVAIEAALSAGTHLRAQLSRDKKVEHKGEIDLVTRVDKEAETLIVSRIKEDFPEHNILAEESWDGTSGNEACERWIIDPLDGTTNFVHNLNHFAVSIAFERKGRLELGVIYDPNRDELFEATLGQGARLNGRPIHVSCPTGINEALIATGFPYDRRKQPKVYLEPFEAILCRCQGIRRLGAASLDLAYIAAGRYDGFWEFKLKPWDVAAGILLIREAGGRAAGPTGAPSEVTDQLIVAGHSDIVDALLGTCFDTWPDARNE